MRYLILLMLAGCASASHVEKGDDLLAELAIAVSDQFPDNPYMKNIAKRASKHADESAGFSPTSILSMLDPIGGLPGLLLLLTGVGGVGVGGRAVMKGRGKGSPQ